MRCISAVLESIGDYEHEKEEVSPGEPVSGGGVDRAAVLRDQLGGGVDRGFGSVTFHVEGFKPSCLTKWAQ